MYVCICNSVTDRQIRQAADQGARSLADLQAQLKVATCCGRCADCAQSLLDEARQQTPEPVVLDGLFSPAMG